MIKRLTGLHSGHRITLNLSNLEVEDVLELLYDCEGMITRLEIFNLKDYADGRTAHLADINLLQQALNEGSVISLKRIIRKILNKVEVSNLHDRTERVWKLKTILHDILHLKALYEVTPLKSRIGSDSTGRSPRVHGMGHCPVQSLRPSVLRRHQVIQRTLDRAAFAVQDLPNVHGLSTSSGSVAGSTPSTSSTRTRPWLPRSVSTTPSGWATTARRSRARRRRSRSRARRSSSDTCRPACARPPPRWRARRAHA